MFEEFWERKKPTKGGGASATPLLACRGSKKLHFGDLGLTQKWNYIFTHIIFVIFGDIFGVR